MTEKEQDRLPEKISFSGLKPKADSSIHMLSVEKELQWQTDDSGKTIIEIPECIRQSPPCDHAFALRFSLPKQLSGSK